MQGLERYRGFAECLSDNGLRLDDERIQWYSTKDMDSLFTRKGIGSLERRFNGCTAIITYNDEIAASFSQAFTARGYKIPDDFSLVSFDNASLNDFQTLSLCTADHPKFELGKRAARNLLRMMEDPEWYNNNYSYRFPVSIVSGNSIKDIHT